MPRLDKILASLGYGSRRDVASLCLSGRVTRADTGERLTRPEAHVPVPEIRVDGAGLDHPDGIFIVMHKPVGVTCSHDAGEGPLVYDLLPPRWMRRNPVVASIGRLDKDTSGTLLLTDQGQLLHRLASPKHHVEKTYLATVEGKLEEDLISRFASGEIMLQGDKEPCRPARLKILDDHLAEVVLTEGRYHQVRRMFAACGHHVAALHRTRFGKYTCENLEPGEWVDATP
ncbi:MAG: pseudouridine synthase [Verrucomicrobiales bacterium]